MNLISRILSISTIDPIFFSVLTFLPPLVKTFNFRAILGFIEYIPIVVTWGKPKPCQCCQYSLVKARH